MALSRRYEYSAVLNFWIARSFHLMAAGTESEMQSANLYYRRALAIDPGNGSFHAFYGEFSVHFGQLRYPRMTALKCSEYKQAQHHLKRSLQILECPAVHFVLAVFLDEVEREYPNASFHYRLAIEGGDHRMRLNYGRLKHKMGRFEEAKRQFVALNGYFVAQNLYSSPSALWFHFHFGRLLVDTKEYHLAQQQFAVCLEIMDRDGHRYFAEIYFEFAKLLLFGLGQRDRALEAITVAVREAPDNGSYRKLYVRLSNEQQRALPTTANVEAERVSVRNDRQIRSSIAQQNGNGQRHGADSDHEQIANPVAEHESPDLADHHIEDEEDGLFPETLKAQTEPTSANNASDFSQLIQRIEGFSVGVADDDEQKEHSADPSEALNVSILSNESLVVENQLARHFEDQRKTEGIPSTDSMPSDWASTNSFDQNDEEFVARLCRNEFDRFIASSSWFGAEFETFYDRMEDEEMNDIRCLLVDKMVDEAFLRNTIGMDTESIALWTKSVSQFVQQHKRFESWLRRIGFHAKYYVKLRNNAILTLQSFVYYNQNAADLVAIIEDTKDAQEMWKCVSAEPGSAFNDC